MTKGLVLGLIALAAAIPALGAQRTFVASTGSDTNVCSLTAPCRTFGAAIARVNAGGEVVVLDSAAYGTVAIGKAVAITAPTGVYAGITVFPGSNGIDIAAAGAVSLRGLTIVGMGGAHGISISGTPRVLIDNCLIMNMNNSAIYAPGPGTATIDVKDSILRENGNGVFVASYNVIALDHVDVVDNWAYGIFSSAGTRINLDRVILRGNSGTGVHVDGGSALIARSQIAGNGGSGIEIFATGPSVAALTVSDSVISGNANFAVDASQIVSTSTVRVELANSVVTRNGFGGIFVQSATDADVRFAVTGNTISSNQGNGVAINGSSTAVVIAAGNTITNNSGIGMNQGSSAPFYSKGDNVVQGNGIGTAGTITTVPTY